MKEYLFSYGTLQKKNVQSDLFGRLLTGSNDILRGYKTSSIKITDKSFLAKGEQEYQLTTVVSNNKDDSIEGTVFEVSAEELLVADKYEPANYKRVKVELDSGKKAWIYIAIQ